MIRFDKISDYLPGLMIASVPFAGWAFFSVGSAFSFTISYVFGFLSIFLLYSRLSSTRNSRISAYREFSSVFIPLTASCAISFIPLWFWEYSEPAQFITSFLHLEFFQLVIFCLLIVENPKKSIEIYAYLYTITAFLVACIGLLDFYLTITTGTGLDIKFNVAAKDAPAASILDLIPRSSSVFFEPGWFAHYLLIDIIIIMTWLAPKARRKHERIIELILYLTSSILIAALLTTLSASAFSVAGATILFITFSKKNPIRSLLIIISALILLSLIPLPYDIPNPLSSMLDRFTGLATGNWVSGESADSRSAELEGAFSMFKDTYFLGAGYGQSAKFVSTIRPVGTSGISSFYGILMAETGVIGVISFSGAILLVNYKLYKIHRRQISIGHNNLLLFCARCVFFAESLFLNFFSALASATYVCSFWLAFMILIHKENIIEIFDDDNKEGSHHEK